jgi:hypothetical protein
MRRPLLVSAAVLVFSTSLPALAQNSPSPGAPPTRIANTYNWRHYQPTQRELEAAGAPPSPQTYDQVENEVEALVKQTDEGVMQANEILGVYPRVAARATR